MSYCVHCGVELAKSEQQCPLCQTPVYDPNAEYVEAEKPYPDTFDYLKRHINLSFGFKLSLLFILAVSAIVIAIDALTADKMTWSFYVAGALVCTEVVFFLPLFIRGYRPYILIVFDFVALSLYMLLIGLINNSFGWVFRLALPLISVISVCLLLSFYFLRRIEDSIFIRISRFLLSLMLMLFAMDAIIDSYLGGILLNWSIFAGIPLLALCILFILLERRKGLRDSFHKRMFF